jgi:broad specificity phosphatase PhoE
MSTLLLIRHGEAQYRTASGAYVPDGALPDRGTQQASALAAALRHVPVDLVLTSPGRRARQTAELAGLDATIRDDLEEWRYGPYTRALAAGRPEADDPCWIWRQASGPQCSEPETLWELTHRIDRVLDDLARTISDHAVAALVSHGHFLRVLTARWLGLPVHTAAQLQLLPASISRLTESGGHRSLAMWNSATSQAVAA